ncbi:formate dehydrogenase accessory sulfurtransferase FdhD [Ktedonosporobacter rubrisoli]|uniref:Sulfur carrier protein FdhD n=2 Tax=Ktedonosporobacter rubrisoli TaxID=2509675 RepID=A0A4P6K5P4_KTERU|nr:formate dehydrogenase accessory sulfurtransferase FdhD [Ktedonosporobacter rubrisoli]
MQVGVVRWQDGVRQPREEQLTVEEPFEIRIGEQSLAVIMRTPGNDRELALGFLFSEGLIQSAEDVLRIEDALDADGLPLPNVLKVILRNQQQQQALQTHQATFERHFAVSASCGLCGKNSIADLLYTTPALEPDTFRVREAVFYDLAAQLRARQTVFSHTGGLHAAGIFTQIGELQLLREDVGRHNAVDKLVGHALLHGLYPYRERILMVSGRTSFEIIQKALLARIPCIVAISAPSSLAVELAEKSGITLIGFLRDRSMNVYTHPERIVP